MMTEGAAQIVNHYNGQSFQNELHECIIINSDIQCNCLCLDHRNSWWLVIV